MKTEKGEVVKVQRGRRVILPILFCEKKGIKENDWVLIGCVEKVKIEIKTGVETKKEASE